MNNPQLVDARGLAMALCIKVPTVRMWLRASDIPVVRIGRLVRFEVPIVMDWVRAGGPSRASQARAQRAHRGARPDVLSRGNKPLHGGRVAAP
jgi:excisionase family DNA binding protein